MDQQKSQPHFYQKFPTWVALSFLSGASVMVAAFVLLGSVPGLSSPSTNDTLAVQTRAAAPAAAAPAISVTILQPGDGQSFGSQSSIPIVAAAQSRTGVSSVAIWLDDQLVKTCISVNCSISVPAASLATQAMHTVQANAKSFSGLTASSIVHFSVQ